MMNATKYGTLPGGEAGEDASHVWTLSVDCRAMCGVQWSNVPDETSWLEPGVVRTAVFPTQAGSHPVGEIRIIHEGAEVRIVGSPTGRAVAELTMDQLRSALGDESYRVALNEWLGVAAS